jgi:hypothetical protein
MKKNRLIKILKKHHKWPSLVLSLFIILFALSGIIMNHRSTFSSFDVNRNYLGKEYQYQNWNKAAVKSAVRLQGDTSLIYGNIGVWKTNDDFKTYSDFNQGFPKGIDNRKIEKMIQTPSGDVYAATLFGLYQLRGETWKKQYLPVKEERIVDLMLIKEELYVLTRSHLLKQKQKDFLVHEIPAAADYDGKISLFKTLWEVHSGEAFGMIGKLFVDFLGLVFLFLTFSGLVYFFFPSWMKRLKAKGKDTRRKAKFLKFNSKWHNKLGYWLFAFFILLTLTGMFLRPPLLIAIASSKVDKLPYTHLDNKNPWYDQLRRILYDEELDRVLLATNEKIYYSDDFFATSPKVYLSQPPISVMGVNVFEKAGKGQYLVGSFSGIFYWLPEQNMVFDYISRKPHVPMKRMGPPISAHPIAGYVKTASGKEILFDYNLGAGNLTDDSGFQKMPQEIEEAPMSLWNFCLEIHTGRIYQYIFGRMYILFIPLAGLAILWLLIAGYWLYCKRKAK